MNLRISVEARSDISEAVEWLAERSPTVPQRFRASLEDTFGIILEHPSMFPQVHREVRRALLRKFPYAVFYIVEGDDAVVVGVVHQARHPSTWQRRT